MTKVTLVISHFPQGSGSGSFNLVLLEVRDYYLFIVLVVHVCPSLIQPNSVHDQTTPVLEWRGSLDERDVAENEHGRPN